MSQLANIEVKNLNHLGIIAGIIDEIGIVEIINEQLGIKPQEKLNNGIIVKSIILNALGFVSRPLYLFTQFFNDKATEHLFREGIVAEDFNDDKIGRVMDKLYQFGLTKIFLLIALKALKEYGIEHKYSHLDSTSISLQGDYALLETKKSENLEPTPIKIVHGYSKDKRPDLKQFLINLIASGDGGIPLFLECGNGNDNDKAKFSQLLSNFKKQIDFDSIFLSLLVYTIGQRQLRANLKQNQTGVKNQLGFLSEKPTLRWIFQCFQGVHLVILNGVKQIVNSH